MGESKVRISFKLGPIEIDFEGSESYLKEDIFVFMNKVADFCDKRGPSVPTRPSNVPALEDDTKTEHAKLSMSVKEMAIHLRANSGPTLTLVAAAHLTLVQKKDTFKRKDLIAQMKSASGYFNQNMVKNLSSPHLSPAEQ